MTNQQMPQAMPGALPHAKHATQRNATHSRNQDQGSDLSALNAAGAVDNPDSPRWIIRKRHFPWTGQLEWRVTHPSLPKYFNHSVHLVSFEDAIGYVDDHTRPGLAS